MTISTGNAAACALSAGPPSLTKLSSKLPTTSDHPSTSTNSSSLNGSEISTGGSIIMLMEIRMVAMTMSITRKGR